jgi:PAS domain S-box-containing protein
MKRLSDIISGQHLTSQQVDNYSQLLGECLSNTCCIVITDSNTRIKLWSRGAEVIFGYTQEEVIDKELSTIININYPQLNETFSLVMKDEKCEIIYNQAENTYFKLCFTAIPDINGKAVGIAMVATDVSDLVKLKKEAEQSNQAKNEFLANVSHDLRTPLVGILGFCGLLMQEQMNPRQKESTDAIHYCAKQLLELVDNLLDLASIEARQVKIEAEVFNLKQTISQILGSFRPEIDTKGLDSGIEYPDEIPEYIVADQRKIKQVLSNLLSNAIKYTHYGYVKVAVKKYSETLKNLRTIPIQISVIDTGIGIKPDDIQFIFEPFTRADNIEANNYSGRGLGLAISKHLVEAMDGIIWYEPNQKEGSVFSFVLPVDEAEPSEQVEECGQVYEPTPVSRARYPSCKVLLAEDIKLNRQLISYMLEDMGYEVIAVENGAECIKTLDTMKPDAILMDMHMPVLNGYKTANIIRESDKWQDIPIIALTAYAMREDIDKCLKAGCNYYLSKPFTREQLGKVLDTCLKVG